jgi:predicted dehydrogenase
MKIKGSKNVKNFTRRDFLKNSAMTVLTLPTIITSSVRGANAPSNRITIGCVGLGAQGSWIIKGFMSQPGTQVVAVCDVDSNHREKAQDTAGLPAKSAYNDFRDLLARDDIDAVVVAAPDHWHVPISIAAAKAGKDIYCEKPLTLTIAGGRALCDTVKRYGRVLQTGSQQRSDSRFRFACELVRNGRIGKLHTIRVEIPRNTRPNPIDWRVEEVPEGFDYDMWLGPAPWAPYTKHRCHYEFRFIFDYSGGQITNWGAHYLDIAQWGNGSDYTGPVEIVGRAQLNTPTPTALS